MKKVNFSQKICFFGRTFPFPFPPLPGVLSYEPIIPKLCVPHLTTPFLSSVNPLFLYIIHISALAANPLLFGRYCLPAVIYLLTTQHTTSQQKIYVWCCSTLVLLQTGGYVQLVYPVHSILRV